MKNIFVSFTLSILCTFLYSCQDVLKDIVDTHKIRVAGLKNGLAINSAAQDLVSDLEQNNYNYSLDENGFPYPKGQYVFKINPTHQNDADVEDICYKMYEIVMQDYKEQNEELERVSFEKCGCNEYVVMNLHGILSDIYGELRARSSCSKAEGIDEIAPDYYGNAGKNAAQAIDLNYHDYNSHPQQVKDFVSNASNYSGIYSQATNPNQVLVAFLGTGLAYFHEDKPTPPYLNQTVPSSSTCIINDPIGYSFIGVQKDPEKDFLNHRGNPNYIDSCLHETQGIYITLNPKYQGSPVYSTADVRILPVKTHDKHGNGTLSSVLCGLRYAVNKGAKIINASIGFENYRESLTLLEEEIKYAQTQNVLIVCSAGNSGKNLNSRNDKETIGIFPAMYNDAYNPKNTNLLVVGAIDELDYIAPINLRTQNQFARYSNYGEMHLDIAAKGTSINQLLSNVTGTTYKGTGTSFAAPLVTAAAVDAILNSQTSIQQIKSYVFDKCTIPNAYFKGKVNQNRELILYAD